MEESLNNNILICNDINASESNEISNNKILEDLEINQPIADNEIKFDKLKNEKQNGINENFDNILKNSDEKKNFGNLKENSAIVGSFNSRNHSKGIKISLKEESKGTYNKKLSKTNYSYLNRFIDYEKRKEIKISKLQKEKNENEIKTLKKKPFISRKSVELINRLNLNDDILERMNDEEKKTKNRKEKLIQKLKKERENKKKELEKPNEYNMKLTKFDNKFDKIYNEMMKKEEILKSKISAFSDMVKEYEMRECIFQPNIFKYNVQNDKNKKKKRISSCDVTRRLYNEEIKNRRNRIDKLNEKYKLTFKPTISNKSTDLALRRREKMKNISKEKTNEENIE